MLFGILKVLKTEVKLQCMVFNDGGSSVFSTSMEKWTSFEKLNK